VSASSSCCSMMVLISRAAVSVRMTGRGCSVAAASLLVSSEVIRASLRRCPGTSIRRGTPGRFVTGLSANPGPLAGVAPGRSVGSGRGRARCRSCLVVVDRGRIASSASTEQWILTGGRLSSSTISVFLMSSPSSTVLPLSHSVARLDGDRRAAAEALELGVLDLAVVVDLDLELHHVAALGGADEPDADVGALLDLLLGAEGADVAGVLVVVDDFVAVCHGSIPSGWGGLSFGSGGGPRRTSPAAGVGSVRLPLDLGDVDALVVHVVERAELAELVRRS
jgi:hypothetical protein